MSEWASVDQEAKRMPDMKTVTLKLTNLRLHASGVFSNVYRGTLHFSNGTKEIAIKKTWPDAAEIEANFETKFLTGVDREKHKNVVSMLFAFSNRAKDGRICESFVFDYMPETLHSLIRKTKMDIIDVKIYAFQLFHGLKYLSSNMIIHRDIKPVNILVDPPLGILKISDFGSAKIVRKGHPSTSYQVTRFYRPPELLLGTQYYDCSVDVWSGGCVLGEMMRRHTLFPGRDSKHQMKLIVQTLGMPDEDDIKAMRGTEKPKHYPKNAPLDEIIPNEKEATAVIEQVLAYNPQKRLGGATFLKHSFFDPIFAPGATRKNGQPISDVISAADREQAIYDVKPKSAMLGIIPTPKKVPKKAVSKDRLPQANLKPSEDTRRSRNRELPSPADLAGRKKSAGSINKSKYSKAPSTRSALKKDDDENSGSQKR